MLCLHFAEGRGVVRRAVHVLGRAQLTEVPVDLLRRPRKTALLRRKLRSNWWLIPETVSEKHT